MIKEGIISLYLYLFKSLFTLFKLFPLKNKTTFLSSFGNNAFFTANELAQDKNQKLIFINQKKCKIDFTSIAAENKKIYSFETLNFLDTIFSIYHLATSKYVFIDNYFGFLSAVNFRKEVKCIQLWHAAGAIKKFGWGDPDTALRSKRAKKRFQQVYKKFQYIPVGSKQMADIFSESFNLDHKHFLYTGVPQTDFYYDKDSTVKGLNRVLEFYPVIKNKIVILYAPTFRKDGLDKMDIQLNIEEFLEKLNDEYVLLVRLHPAIQEAAVIPNHPRIHLVSDYPHINELLLASDILITDYSSIPFEFSFLRKKMIFFTYDLESYNREQGVWAENSLYFPGPIVKSTSEVIDHIKDNQIDFEKIDRFRNHWNTFSSGTASQNLISAIYGNSEEDISL